jgi:hypothetical protein
MADLLGLGYDPEAAARAKAAMRAGSYSTVARLAVSHQAKSLAKHRRRSLQQGQAGTCWLHAPTQHAEITMGARGLKGFDVCRRLVGWAGQQYYGGRNPSDGGSGMNAYKALAETGVAHEDVCPYTDSRWTLGTKPDASVFADAAKAHLTVPVDVQTFDDAITLIDHDDTPTSIGWWWTAAWDSPQTFMTSIGWKAGYHEILIIGYAKAGTFDQNEWIQFDNWHGDLYPPLHPQFAAKVDGYTTFKPDATSDFWVERSLAERVYGFGNSDMASASDLTGVEKNVIVPSAKGLLPF